MTAATQVFDIADALVMLLRTAPEFADALVLDGPETSGVFDKPTIAVMVPALSETAAASAQVNRSGPGGLGSNDSESFSITGAISSRLGSGTWGEARAVIRPLFEGLCRILKADMTVAGTAHMARVGNWSMWNLNTPSGYEVLISFEVVGFTQL